MKLLIRLGCINVMTGYIIKKFLNFFFLFVCVLLRFHLS